MALRHRIAAWTFALLAVSSVARAEVSDCTVISSLPYAVSAPGIYCLKGSLSLDESGFVAVRIEADDVVLDLNGHTLDGFGAGVETASIGVRAIDRKNVTVRNGTIRGFSVGVYLAGSNSQVNIAERLRLDSNPRYGMIMQGLGHVVRNNLVTRTGGSTGGVGPYGILASGAVGVHVAENEVVETVEVPGLNGYAILVEGAPGAVIERNVITNRSFGPGVSFGIRISSSASKVHVVGNRIANMRNGIYFYPGATGLYMDNTVTGATAPFTGGTAAGATNFSF